MNERMNDRVMGTFTGRVINMDNGEVSLALFVLRILELDEDDMFSLHTKTNSNITVKLRVFESIH